MDQIKLSESDCIFKIIESDLTIPCDDIAKARLFLIEHEYHRVCSQWNIDSGPGYYAEIWKPKTKNTKLGTGDLICSLRT